jgi:hypothetical protein
MRDYTVTVMVVVVVNAMVPDLRQQQMQAFAENRNAGEDSQQNTAQKSSIH